MINLSLSALEDNPATCQVAGCAAVSASATRRAHALQLCSILMILSVSAWQGEGGEGREAGGMEWGMKDETETHVFP